MGVVPDGVRADAGQVPGTGEAPGRAQEVPIQEQNGKPGWEHHRPVDEHVRLGEIPADQGRHQAASAAGPRWLLAGVRSGDRGQDQRDQGGAHPAVRTGHDPGDRPRLQRFRVVPGTDPGGRLFCDADEKQHGLHGGRGVRGSGERECVARSDHLSAGPGQSRRGAGAIPAHRILEPGQVGNPSLLQQPVAPGGIDDHGDLQGPLAGGIVLRELDMVHSFVCLWNFKSQLL